MKQWSKRGENSWTMFKVMAEFVDGFEILNTIGPRISIFDPPVQKAGNLVITIWRYLLPD
ncbi:MAG: hypothetical protein R2778_11480 [Saprospiraceae bacterium]